MGFCDYFAALLSALKAIQIKKSQAFLKGRIENAVPPFLKACDFPLIFDNGQQPIPLYKEISPKPKFTIPVVSACTTR